MTDTIRDLLISLGGHIAYMQGQLEARHELDDFEDFYWYRESVLLRQKVMDALTDEPAAGEPASVTRQPSDEAWDALVERAWDKYQTVGYQGERFMYDRDFGNALEFVRQGLARWGNPASQPHADGKAADRLDRYDQALSAVMPSDFKDWWQNSKDEWPDVAAGVIESLRKREELAWEQAERLSSSQPVPVSVSERLPGPEDCLDKGWAWFFSPRVGWRQAVLPVSAAYTHWLPAYALPVPGQEVSND